MSHFLVVSLKPINNKGLPSAALGAEGSATLFLNQEVIYAAHQGYLMEMLPTPGLPNGNYDEKQVLLHFKGPAQQVLDWLY